MLQRYPKNSGFTLVELVIVMAVITVLISATVPLIHGMTENATLTKCESELNTLKSSIISYWRNNNYRLPGNITTELIAGVPQMVQTKISDPWTTDTVNNTYGYIQGTDPRFGPYF